MPAFDAANRPSNGVSLLGLHDDAPSEWPSAKVFGAEAPFDLIGYEVSDLTKLC